MRVLQVIARMNIGGTARYLTSLTNGLTQTGIESKIATGFVQGAESEDPSVNSVEIIRVPALGRAINPVKDLTAIGQLQKIIREYKPDIIHTHTFKAGFVGRYPKPSTKRVHTFHGHLFDDPEFSGPKSVLITAIERSLAKKTDKLVTVGQRVADDLLEREIGNQNQFVNIPPGVVPLVELERNIARTELGISQDQVVVGWLARMTGVKNPHLALEVARALPHIQFLMGGAGDLLAEIRSAAPLNVKVLGWVDAAKFIAASDIIFSTSENDGMPIALIEAQLAGKPIVATDAGSVAEVVINNQSGFVVNRNIGQIKGAIEKLISDPALRSGMGTAGKIRSSEYFATSKMIAAHISLYQSLIK